MLSGDGSAALTEDDHRLANELAAELAQQNKSLVDGDHHDDTHLMTSYLYSTDFDLNPNSKHSSQTSNHINNQQVLYFYYTYLFTYKYTCIYVFLNVLYRLLVQTI